MAFTLEAQLTLINLLCRAYVMGVLFLKALVFLNMTFPEVCNKDSYTFHCITIFAYLVCINVAGNYICMWYMSRLSVVKPEHLESMSDADLALSQDLTSSLTSSMSDNVHHSRHLASSGYCELNKKLTNNVNEYASLLTDTDNYENTNILLQTDSLVSNSKHSSGSYFTFQNNFNGNNISLVSHHDFESKSFLESDVVDLNAIKTTRPKCKDCNILVPPRAKHCPVCRLCVLKRDHHCFFVGCCIGYHNQRFFIIFCLYVAVGEIFNSVVTFLYLRQHNLGESTSWGFLEYVLPVLLFIWFRGGVSASALRMTVLLYWSVLTALLCTYFFCQQMNFVYYGQTKYERRKGIKTYQGTVWKNITSVFGRFWLVGLIMPAPFLGYQSDGADWRHLTIDNKIP